MRGWRTRERSTTLAVQSSHRAVGPYVASEGVQRAPQAGVAWSEVQKPQTEVAAQEI